MIMRNVVAMNVANIIGFVISLSSDEIPPIFYGTYSS